MFKKTFIALTLPLLFLLVMAASPPEADRGALGSSSTAARRHPSQADATSAPGTGTLQKMIVENGGVTMDFDLNGLNGSSSLVARPITLQFAVGANSFFPILVFNDQLRGAEPGSMALVPSSPDKSGQSAVSLPANLSTSLKQLVVEKLCSDRGYHLLVRDGNTGFTFFNVAGGEYNYDANAQFLSITNGRLLLSKEFANALGRPLNAGAIVGKISVGAAMQPIEINRL